MLHTPGYHQTHNTQSSKVLFLDSKDAHHRHGNETTHYTYVFRDTIEVAQNEGILGLRDLYIVNGSIGHNRVCPVFG
eukprot:SAG31_NODE_4227_length_3444_cov_20.637668_3_plen_77_part_00